ncbi:zinc finger protein 558-like [Littorina saxatilis]|uniref:zinc finger protein 558-like n=1 Tax=Littorina saxatilis TaxID=31220 RepID=UPI0038B43DEB
MASETVKARLRTMAKKIEVNPSKAVKATKSDEKRKWTPCFITTQHQRWVALKERLFSSEAHRFKLRTKHKGDTELAKVLLDTYEEWEHNQLKTTKSQPEAGFSHWSGGGGDGMEGEDPAVKTEVKIEIDVAEEPPQSWFMTQQHTHGQAAANVDSDIWQKEEAGEGQATVSADSDTWLKEEAGEELSGTDSNFNTDSQLNTNSTGAHLSAGKTRPKEHTFKHLRKQVHRCSHCSSVFDFPSRLETHLLTHTGERPHKCNQCSAAFARSGALKDHILTHTGERPHKCSQCSAAFALSGSRKVHMLTHTGERPHKCGQCSAAFTRSGSLKDHMFTHTGERPHKCHQCSAGFARSGALNIHMLTHTGERPHECCRCNAAFAHSGSLKNHMLTHTGERPHKCNQCSAAFSGCYVSIYHKR